MNNLLLIESSPSGNEPAQILKQSDVERFSGREKS